MCGEFCIFFAFHLSRNVPLENMLSYFSSNLKDNDDCVRDFMNKTFPGHERSQSNDINFWINRIQEL